MKEYKHKIKGLVLEDMGEALRLIMEAKREMAHCYELFTWSFALTEEELKEKRRRAYLNAESALEKARPKLEMAMDMVADVF